MIVISHHSFNQYSADGGPPLNLCQHNGETREGLGGHLKTGHPWTLQNRPTGEHSGPDLSYTRPEWTGQVFSAQRAADEFVHC
jgi:hypothetical protein